MSRVELRWLCWSGAVLLAAGLAVPARAQDPDDMKRAVARISHIDGEVSVKRGDSGDWVAGVINAPLIADDRIAAGPSSRAEIELDGANVMYMGGTSEIHLSALEYGRYQMELGHGMITYRILKPVGVNVEVDTPSVSVRPSNAGTYRISVNDNGETQVEVRAGSVEVFTPRGSQWVNAGQMLLARGSASDPEFQVVSANPPDDWDRWCESRDRVITQSPSGQYMPQGVYGGEDLDQYGSWVDYPDYGYVWRPTVAPGWAPYQSGRWVWEDWYGWTWVSYDPWGWAPFHYGRWFWGANYGWCWYPGVFGARHYWSPGLVAFFGFGGGGFAGFGFGNVGWVPLAPYEVFHPWWGRGFYAAGGFNRFTNITNVNVTNFYRNARGINGVSAVSATDFREGRFNNVMRPGAEQLRTAGAVHGAMPFHPGAGAVNFANRQAGYVPRAGSSAQHFFTHQQAPAVQHAQVFQQQRMANMNNYAGSRTPSTSAGSMNNRPPASGGAAGSSTAGWRRFGESAPSAAPRGGQTPNSSNGIQRFGEPSGGQRTYNAPSTRNDRPSYSAPSSQSRSNQPAQSSPQQHYSAPAPQRSYGGGGSGSSGGGGGSHPSGGGGGGHASGSNNGGHHR